MRFGRRDNGGAATMDDAVRPNEPALQDEVAGEQPANASDGDNGWQNSFLEKLSQAQSRWLRRFEEVLEDAIAPVFANIKDFLADNGFHVSSPLRELGRRSYKFELAENAYLLVIFRSLGVGEFEARYESFVPGCEPSFKKTIVRVSDVGESWARKYLQTGLDNFIDQLAKDNNSGG